jgi:hypothetical protein
MKRRLVLIVFFLAVSMAASVRAALIIDTFDTPHHVGAIGPNSNYSFSNAAAPEAIGGFRSIDITRTSGLGSAIANVNTDVPSKLAVSTDATSTGINTVYWGENTIDGLNFVDLTQGGVNHAFSVSITPGAQKLQLVVKATAFGQESQLTILNPSGPTALFPFANFHLTGAHQPIDFTHVGAIDMLVTLGNGSSVSVDSVLAVVPEPGTASLAAMLAIVGMVMDVRWNHGPSPLIIKPRLEGREEK